MKVAFFSYGYDNHGNGISTYVYQMSTALCQIGHDAVIFTNRTVGKPEVEKTDAATIYRIYDNDEIRSYDVAQKVVSLADKLKVDLIEGADHLGECAPLLAIERDVPVMVKVHCSNAVKVLYQSEILYFWQHIMVRLAQVRKLGQFQAERLSIQNADLLCAPSMRLIRELQKQKSFKNLHIGLIPNPFVPSSTPSNVENSIPMVLFVGRLCIGKGISYLPKIMTNIWRDIPDCQLVIAGNDSFARGLGSLKRWLRRQFGQKVDQVLFTGNLNEKTLIEMYDRAWVVIIPSRWDNFPAVALESMARKRPIVASPHGGMPEMLKDTRNIIADPECDDFSKAVSFFLKDKHLRGVVGAEGLKRVRDVYTPKIVAKQYVSFVQQELSLK